MNKAIRKTNYRTAKKAIGLYTYKVPNIVIVGDKSMKRQTSNIEINFNINLKFTTPAKLEDFVDSETVAVIIDENKIKTELRKFLLKVLKRYKFLPVFYLSRTIKRTSFYKELYESGLHGAVKWPSEAKILYDLIIESLKPRSKTGGISKTDKRVADLIKSHLIITGNYKSIKVEVIEGFAYLNGSVKSLYDKEFIERESLKVLGVNKVIVKDIKIKQSNKITDIELERKIKMYIGNILGSKKRSISIKVKNKVATLIGAADSHGDVLDIKEFISRQSSIREVNSLVKYRSDVVSKNTKEAKLLEKKIKCLFDGVKHISVNIYGEYAEVSGTVTVSADRSLIERYLMQVLPIKKVINKLFVSKNL